MGVTVESLASPVDLAGRLIGGAKYDLAIVVLLLAASLLLFRLFAHHRNARRLISAGYASAVVLSLIAAIVNVTAVQYLGAPLSYQWFYYSDFGMATDIYVALASIVTWDVFLRIPLGIAALFTASYVLVTVVTYLQKNRAPRRVFLLLTAILIVTVIPSSRHYWNLYSADQGTVANPLIYFVHSLLTRNDAPLLAMDTTFGSEDFRITAERPDAQPADHPIKHIGIRNVLIYVLESVPARYVETYGGKFPVTPIIAGRATQSIRFANIYTHAPNSHKALVSILTSMYPLISHKTLTREKPDAQLTSMSGELKRIGYRTGFFYSADLRYAQEDEFLAHHSFDVIKDFRSMDCETTFDTGGDDAFRYSNDDACTMRRAIDWIDSRDDRPFFAVVWTNMTHLPYYSPPTETVYSEGRDDFNRYLNALRHGDQALGELLASLDSSGRAASTLVVITGDHGQAFGEHGQRGHGANLYQENIHVPLIMTHPALADRGSNDVVGGLIDIAPTVFDVLGLRPPPLWQGTSLFATERPQRTYFFATWTNLQFGYREGDRKFIFNATANRCEAFDLASDPQEARPDLAAGGVDCNRIQERLAAWIQYQDDLAAKIVRTDQESATEP